MNPLIPQNTGSSMMQNIGGLVNVLRGKDPQAVFNMMAQNNPQFAQFVQTNKSKSPQQIARDYGIDWGMVQQFLK